MLRNLHCRYITHLKHISIIDEDLYENVYIYDDESLDCSNSSSTRGLKFYSLFVGDNLLLSKSQRRYILGLEINEAKLDEVKFHIHLSKVCDDYYLVFCKCCVCKLLLLLNDMSSSIDNAVAIDFNVVSPEFKGIPYSNEDIVWLYFIISFLQLSINPSLPKIYNILISLLPQLQSKVLLKYSYFVGNLLLIYPKEWGLWNLKLMIYIHRLALTMNKRNNCTKGIIVYNKRAKRISRNLLSFKAIVNNILKDHILLFDLKFIPNILQVKPHNNYVARYLINLYNKTIDISSDVLNTSIRCLAERSSPVEVQSNSLPLAESSSNYLPLKSKATPRDRGKGEGGEDVTSCGIPGSDLRELEGELNRESRLQDKGRTSGGDGRMTSSEFCLHDKVLNVYKLCLDRFIDCYFKRLYYRILEDTGYQGVLILLLSIIEKNKNALSIIDDYQYLIEFCDDKIPIDNDYCWIDNKTLILSSILNNLPYNTYHTIHLILQYHINTWNTFTDPYKILFLPHKRNLIL